MKKFLVTLFFGLVLFLLCGSCLADNNSSRLVTKPVSVTSFTELSIQGDIEVELIQGSTHEVVIYAPKEVLPDVKITQTGNKLNIVRAKHFIKNKRYDVTVSVTMNTLAKLDMKNGAELKAKGVFSGSNIAINLNGASDVDRLHIKANNTQISLRGASDFNASIDGSVSIRLEGASEADLYMENALSDLKATLDTASSLSIDGTVRLLDITASAASGIDADEAKIKKANITLGAASRAELFVLEELSYRISAASRLTVSGNPRILSAVSKGASTFRMR